MMGEMGIKAIIGVALFFCGIGVRGCTVVIASKPAKT